jgi:hypothetical protein
MGLTMLLHYWESAPNPTEDRKSSKKIACGGQFSILSSKLNGFDHVATLLGKCSKSHRRSQIFKKNRLRRAVQYTFSKLNGFDHCYIAGKMPKMLQIRPKTANFQKKSPAAGSSVY